MLPKDNIYNNPWRYVAVGHLVELYYPSPLNGPRLTDRLERNVTLVKP